MANKDFKKLRRACYQEISAPTSTLPKDLVHELKPTKSLDDMLDVLALSPYWNWFDTRLLQALVSASGSPEAEAMLEQFKQIHYAHKVSEILPCVIVRPIKDSVVFIEKFNKDPSELTLLDLLQHKHILEYEVMDVGESKIVLSCIRTGCIEMIWQIPLDLVYQAYTSVKKNFDKFSSLAIKSLVCKQADELAGLPILWRGQEVGEVGPIKPLPEHVRQEPYSLPQGFHWVSLSSSNIEEVLKFINKYSARAYVDDSSAIDFIMSHPNTKDEWQFGIRTTNGKLVAVVSVHPVCISIGGVSITSIRYCIVHHPKYNGKRIEYLLIKELMRRVNLCNINHLVMNVWNPSILKPISTIHRWKYIFDHPTSYQLPSSPRTPGWRRMTSEDVPSALALINKWSSQFEIRQVFNSEEEFAHSFLHPTVVNYVYTYVVENETNITDLVSFQLANNHMVFGFTAVASTQSPLKQLIIDALVCAKELGAKALTIENWNIEPDVLPSLSFHYDFSSCFSIYNYKYHEISETRVWYL